MTDHPYGPPVQRTDPDWRFWVAVTLILGALGYAWATAPTPADYGVEATVSPSQPAIQAERNLRYEWKHKADSLERRLKDCRMSKAKMEVSRGQR